MPIVPQRQVAGWLNTSAGLGASGNIVLVGQYGVNHAVFRDLWILQPGDDIWLYAGEHSQRYIVSEVVTLPEEDQPLKIRLNNARYIQPANDKKLTLVTSGPDHGNTSRVIVVARPEVDTQEEKGDN